MINERETAKQWQFGLREMFGGVLLLAIVISLTKVGFCFTSPLIAAMALQVSGRRRAANWAAIATLVFWLCFPFLYAIWYVLILPDFR